MNKLTKSNFLIAITRYARLQPRNAPDFSDEFVLDFWFEQVGHYGSEALGTAFKKLCSGSHFPSIEQVKRECGDGNLSDDAAGRDIADRIWQAISKYGSYNWEKAAEYIGEVGQVVVGGPSGWRQICDTATYSQSSTLKAQWREAAKGKLESARLGQSGPPKLPAPNNAGSLMIKAAMEKAKNETTDTTIR